MGWPWGKKEENEKLNTEDVKKGISYALDVDGDGKVTAKDFERFFQWKAAAAGLIASDDQWNQVKSSEAYKMAEKQTTAMLDQDGDGRITPKDFQILFENNMRFLDKNAKTLDLYLPFAGQCAFGVTAGFATGRLARSFIKHKFKLLALGGIAFSGGQAFIKQQDDFNVMVARAKAEQVMMQVCDRNKDGKLGRDDLEKLFDANMEVINRKLGPGGFAPGLVGFGTFGLGALYGIRAFAPLVLIA